MAYDSFYKIDVENFKILYTNTEYWAYFCEMLYVLICFISTAPQETTEALFLECCPNSSHPGLVARAAAAQPILIKMEYLKCWSMEKGYKGFHYLFSKLTVREGCTPPFPRHKTTHIPLNQLKHQDKGSSSAWDNARSHDRQHCAAASTSSRLFSNECKMSGVVMSDGRGLRNNTSKE